LAAALLSAAVARPAAASENGRYISNSDGSYLEIVDSETWPEVDEKGTFTLRDPRFYGGSGLEGLLVTPSNPIDTAQTSKCVGNEVRVSVQTRAELSSIYTDWVRVTVTARLYEGTSCSTIDLDGSKSMSFWIAPGATNVQKQMDVYNTDEGGDHAFIRFYMDNMGAVTVG
jgi:hypothetical protein